MSMKFLVLQHAAITLLFFIIGAMSAKPDTYVCRIPPFRGGHCFLKPIITCPSECPTIKPKDPNAKACYINCYSPKCEATCRKRKPDCNSPGSACYDPRFIGADGIVFYFHGKSNQHFSLVSDPNLQINARFIGHRPSGRTRDYTWIQGLGILFGAHAFTVEAKRVAKWDDDVDQFQFSYDGKALSIPESHFSEWNSPEQELRVERTSTRNSVTVTLPGMAEVSISIVPVTEQDDKIHNYQIPSNDCFTHLEVQFRFIGLSSAVEGVLGRTYRPDFKNPAKPGVAMPVVGGEDKYRTSSLLSADCAACTASFEGVETKESSLLIDYGMLDCTSGGNSGGGIVCRR
ncbi:hypothetical protein Sjap_000089 [Stephania japonica]|uniref:Uncharacterized protein n=1 Tax=Stephania japonica TaxID=461633 RepID=A0AAP0KJI5_9MAGN